MEGDIQISLYDSKNSEDSVETGPVSSRKMSCLTNFAFLLFGITAMISWSSFNTCIPYFQSYMHEYPLLENSISKLITFFSMLPLIFGSIFNILYLYKIHQSYRVYLTKISYLFCVVLLSMCISLDASPPLMFSVVLFAAFLMAFTNSIMILALYIDAGFYGSSCVTFFIVGQGLSGLVIPFIKMCVVAVDMSDKQTAILFYGIVNFVIMTSLIFYFFMITSKEYMKWKEDSIKMYKPNTIPMFEKIKQFKAVFLKKWVDGLTIYLSLAVSLFIFPHLVINILPVYNNYTWKKIYVYFCCFLGYGIGDFVGRYTDLFIKFPKPGSYVMLVTAFSRLLFFFIFSICNQRDSPIFPSYIKDDTFPFIINVIFALSGTHLMTIAFKVPFTLENETEQADCSTVFVLLLALGLTTGTLLAFSLPNQF